MLKVYDIPHLWRTQLKEIQKVFPDAVIAGGCLRDLYHGVEFKDIDIFVPNCDDPKISALLQEFKAYHSYEISRTVMAKSDYKEWASTEVESVFTLKVGSLSVDVIGCTSDPDKIIERFDFGICQIQFDGTDVRCTEGFRYDVVSKTFTLIRSDKAEDYERALRRWEKFRIKYPNHVLDKNGFEKKYGAGKS